MNDQEYTIYEGLKYDWEPGNEARKRINKEYALTLRGPQFYSLINNLEEEQLVERKIEPKVVHGVELNITHLRKLPGGERPPRPLDDLVLEPV